MAFAAVISMKKIIEELINSPRISLSPSCKEMMEFAYQQLKSLPEVLKRLDRLDGSSMGDCRKKVNAVDARIKEAVWEFQDLIESHVDNQMLSQSDQILRYDVHLHELRPDVDDFIQKLKKMEEEYIYEVLFPSYEYLPQHLKPCFLYMGVFPLNHEISKSNILRLWVAEGFLEPYDKTEIEYSVRMYLEALIGNSVVIRCQTRTYDFYDPVKTCRLQAAFWHLCYREARKSRFFHALTSVADCVEENMKSQRRLSFHNNILFAINVVYDALEQGCASTARSLLCFGPFCPYTVPICFNLRLLKVLDALQIRFYEFPIQVLRLAHLKYLSLTYNGELPASISKLWNLQVLIIYRYISIIKSGGPPSYVPMEIWDMQELKHIQIMGTNLPNPSSDTSLYKLLTLIGVSARTCTKEVLERIPHLRKLGIQIELLPDDDMKALHCLNHVVVLRELRSLKCAVVNPMLRSEIVTLPAPLSMFPRSLVKLHLSGLGYPWKYMSIIGSLPTLEVLKLRCYAFRGPKWEVKAGEFEGLRYLLIEDTDLVQFKVESGGFRWLESLRLKHCYKLEDIQWNGNMYNNLTIGWTECKQNYWMDCLQTKL